MSKGNWRFKFAIGRSLVLALALAACGEPPETYSPPPSLAASEDSDANRPCGEECASAPRSEPNEPVAPARSVNGPIQGEASAAGQRDPAQERDDLVAQWRSAIAAENLETLAYQQIGWSVVEIILIFLTLAAGVWAIREARISSERQLRAYICVHPGLPSSFVFQDDLANVRYRLTPIVRNHGQTPAYEVEHIGTVRLLLDPLPDDYSYSVPRVMARTSAALIGPSQQLIIPNHAEAMYAPHDLVQAEGDGPLRIFTFGTITYRDAFNRRRYTNYCWVINWENGQPIWFANHSHNDAN